MAIKAKCPEFENHERWLVSYADMLTLLFAVFVVLYSLNMSSSKSDSKQVTESMQESFQTPLPDIPVDRRVGPIEQGIGIFEHFKGQTIRPSLIQKYPSSSTKVKTINDDMARVKLQLQERLYGNEKFRSENKPGQERVVDVVRTAKGFKLQLLARHFFDPGSVTVTRGALRELDQVAGLLKDLGKPINIQGHTDSIPPEGDRSNWEISSLRATNVLRYFLRNHGFPASTLSASGYADTRPIASNGSESGRMLNRRIEIHVDYDDDTSAEP